MLIGLCAGYLAINWTYLICSNSFLFFVGVTADSIELELLLLMFDGILLVCTFSNLIQNIFNLISPINFLRRTSCCFVHLVEVRQLENRKKNTKTQNKIGFWGTPRFEGIVEFSLFCRFDINSLIIPSKSKNKVDCPIFKSSIIRNSSIIFELTSARNQPLLVWRDSFFILNVLFQLVDCISVLSFNCDRFSSEGFDNSCIFFFKPRKTRN